MVLDQQISLQLSHAALMVTSTVFVHAIFIAIAAAVFRHLKSRIWGPLRVIRDVLVLVVVSLWLLAAHAIEIGMWAMMFLRLDLFDGFEPALYFAAVSYTTLGFGDVLLTDQWRLLSGAVAASGLLLFGLSAAFLIEATGKLRLGGEPH